MHGNFQKIPCKTMDKLFLLRRSKYEIRAMNDKYMTEIMCPEHPKALSPLTSLSATPNSTISPTVLLGSTLTLITYI